MDENCIRLKITITERLLEKMLYKQQYLVAKILDFR